MLVGNLVFDVTSVYFLLRLMQIAPVHCGGKLPTFCTRTCVCVCVCKTKQLISIASPRGFLPSCASTGLWMCSKITHFSTYTFLVPQSLQYNIRITCIVCDHENLRSSVPPPICFYASPPFFDSLLGGSQIKNLEEEEPPFK